MRKNFGTKPLSYSQPVCIIATYGEDCIPNAMNAAWGGISEMGIYLSTNKQPDPCTKLQWPAKKQK